MANPEKQNGARAQNENKSHDTKFIPSPQRKPDIEHAEVSDDPRKWSKVRKGFVLAIISGAAMIAGLGGNIYNPAIAQIESDLHASPGQISLSLSLFIMIQGVVPLLWCAVSEIHGRKHVYLSSLAICIVGCIVQATAKTIEILIAMRCFQALGSSAVIALGASTLADIYDPHERGTMMGIYYCAPLMGPALGPILGGALAQAFGWRATFWFLSIFTTLCFVAFVYFKDTFRRERSLTYQTTLLRLLRQRKEAETARQRSGTSSIADIAATNPNVKIDEKDKSRFDEKHPPTGVEVTNMDVEAQRPSARPVPNVEELKLSLRDFNPVKPIIQVLCRPNNLVILFASGLTFAFNYSVTYTCSRTLSSSYGYDALQIGLVLLTFGVGCIFGSVLGGRWSDHVFTVTKAKNGGVSTPEMRLKSVLILLPFLPASVAAYGWVSEKHLHIAVMCVMLFLCGFSCISIYASTLAYIVDANVGRSSSAVATNSCFRGISAFIAAEAAVPLQVAIGDGGTYSLWAGLLLVAEVLIVLVWWKGRGWRERAEKREAQNQQ